MNTESEPTVYCPLFPQRVCQPQCPNYGEARIFHALADLATQPDQEIVERLQALGVDLTVFTTESAAAAAATTHIDPYRCYWKGIKRLAQALTLPPE